MKLDLEELRKVANKATKGPWYEHEETAEIRSGNDTIVEGMHGVNDYDLIYIATFNPQTIITIIDYIEALSKIEEVNNESHT